MKYILCLLFLTAILFESKAQTDSSQLYLPFQMKQKFAADLVPDRAFKLEDARLIDTLNKAMGSGTHVDSVCTINLKVGTYLSLLEANSEWSVIGYYSEGTEFYTSPLTGNGYSGLIPTLDYYAANGTALQKAAAIWFRTKLNDLIARKQAVTNERRVNNYLKTHKVVVYN